MIERNELDNTHLVYGGYLQDWLLYNTDFNWRLEPERKGKSRAIADIGSHWCDTIQFVLGRKIIEVFADLKTLHQIASSFTHYPGGYNEGWPDALKNQFIDFYSTIIGKSSQGKSYFASIEDGHRIMRIVDAILESYEKKCWVTITDELPG